MVTFSYYRFLTFLTGSCFENWQPVNQLPFNITSNSSSTCVIGKQLCYR